MSVRSHPGLPTALLSLACLALAAFGADAPTAPATPAKPDAPAAGQPADLKIDAPATPENAAAFVGSWNLALEGPNGAAAMKITLKGEAGKVTGELSSELMESQKFAEVIRSGTGLVMRYHFDYQGMAIEAEAKLTPAGDKMNATVSFAGGAFVLEGAATKQSAK
jgi:hypothetical protein